MSYSIIQIDYQVKKERALHLSESEWGSVISRIFCEVIAMADVIEVIGAGEKLRAYLISKNKHEVLAGLVVEIKELLKKQSQENRILFADSDPLIVWLRTSAYDASALVLAVKDTFNQAESECIKKCKELAKWAEINVPEMANRKGSINRYVNLGGQTENEQLRALYRVAYPLKKDNNWKSLQAAVDMLISDGNGSSDIRLVTDLWAGKTDKQKRENLRYIFPKELPIQGI